MSSSHHRRQQCSGHFPDDPRFSTGGTLKATANEFDCLGKDVFLSTAVLDCLLHISALNPDSMLDIEYPPLLGSLGCQALIQAYLSSSTEEHEGTPFTRKSSHSDSNAS